MIKSIKNIALFTLFTVALFGCKPDETTLPTPTPTPAPTTAEMHFMFENYFGNDALTLNTGSYTNLQGEDLKIEMFNYWITNIVFVKEDGSEYAEPESYRVLRADKHSSLHFHIADVPAGTYKGVKFMIGVDVPRNTSGAQTGALDPNVNGDMYWSWNTGYIQLKMEGTSSKSTETNNAFRYHIGGVASGMETPRDVSLDFPTPVTIGDKAGSIKIKTDAAKMFGPTNPVSIAMMANMTHPGAMAAKIADNYKNMFSLTSAGNE